MKRLLLGLAALGALAACSKSEEKPPEVVRPVLSVVARVLRVEEER